MDEKMKWSIQKNNWKAFNSNVKAEVDIVCTADTIRLKYSVEEPTILAQQTEINSPVYQDSCVEFFVSFDRVHYYNIECNAIGTLLVQYGDSREGGIFLLRSLFQQLKLFRHLEESLLI